MIFASLPCLGSPGAIIPSPYQNSQKKGERKGKGGRAIPQRAYCRTVTEKRKKGEGGGGVLSYLMSRRGGKGKGKKGGGKSNNSCFFRVDPLPFPLAEGKKKEGKEKGNTNTLRHPLLWEDREGKERDLGKKKKKKETTQQRKPRGLLNAPTGRDERGEEKKGEGMSQCSHYLV